MKEEEIQGHSLSPSSGSTEVPGVTGSEVCRGCHGDGKALSIQGIPDAKCPVCGGSGRAEAPVQEFANAVREEVFESPLDPGIKDTVLILRAGGVETFESCEGGPGHAFPEPTVRFHGNHPEGFRALSVALTHGLKVFELRRYYSIIDGEPSGPYWEMVFTGAEKGRDACSSLESISPRNETLTSRPDISNAGFAGSSEGSSPDVTGNSYKFTPGKPCAYVIEGQRVDAAIPVQLPSLRDIRGLVEGVQFFLENHDCNPDFMARTKELADAAVKLLDQMIGDEPEQAGDGLSPVSGLAEAPGVTGAAAFLPAPAIEDSVLSISSAGGAPLVTIKPDGAIVYGERYHPDDAARIFWAAMSQHVPGRLAAAPQYIRDIAAYLAANQNESVAVLVVDGAHRIVKIAATNWEEMDATAALLNLCRDARAFHEAGKARGDFAGSKPNDTPAPETHDTPSSGERVKG